MKLNKDIELLDGMPIAFIKSLDALVIADSHLGYEGVMAKQGMLIPKVNLKKLIASLSDAIKMTKASKIIVNGDIKNEFSKVDQEEFNELYDFVKFVKEKGLELILIKGNHDNFVERYKEPFKLQVYRQEALLGKYLFFHGEELPREIATAEMLIMGHEHPAIGVYNEAGRKIKLRCFLYGEYEGKPLLVVPAINYFAGGTEINIEPKDGLLSPVLKSSDLGKMHAIALGYGSTVDFGTIAKLREAAHR
jgi:putative SbcD/Mre11-related phosphoesterase